MDDAASRRAPDEGDAGPLDYPTNRVIGSVDRTALGVVIPDLIDAGFAPVGILAGEAGLRRLRETEGGSGIGGLLRRFAQSVGGDLDYIRQAEQDLRDGRALVDVEVVGDAQKELARDVLLRHGGHAIVYFAPGALESLA